MFQSRFLRRAIGALFTFVAVSGPVLATEQDRRVGDPIDISGIPLSVSGSFLSGRLATVLKDNSAAASFLAETLRADPGNRELLERTFIAHVAAGRIEESLPFAEKLVAIDKNHRFARMVLGAKALRDGKFDAARTEFGFAAQKPILDLIAPLLAAWAATGAGDAAKGIGDADRIKGEDWYQTFKDFNIGLMLDVAGDTNAAIMRLKAAYARDPSPIRVVEALARAQMRVGQKDAARKIVEDYLARSPRQPAMLDLLDAIKKDRPIDRAVASPQAGAADTLIAIAVPLGRQGGQDFALAFLQMALYLDPANAPALVAIADVFQDMKQPQNAAAAFERVPASSPLRRNADIALAMTLDQIDRTEEGIAKLQAVLTADPQNFDAVTSLGNIYQSRKRFADAAEAYSRAIAMVPTPDRGNWGLFYYRGIAFERTKQWPKAEADFRKALELFPDQPDVLNYLGYSFIDQGINFEEGLAMIRSAVAQRPDSGYIVDSLGWANYKLGKYDEAVTHLERAVELKPNDPVINDHLGDAYWKVGRTLEATFQWHHALDANPAPEPEDRIKIERKLKEGLVEDASNQPKHAGPSDQPAAPDAAKAGSGG